MNEGELTVVTPLDGSPAAKAEIEPGDVILEVDNQSVWGMSLSEALDIIDGDPSTDLILLISRENSPKPFEAVCSEKKSLWKVFMQKHWRTISATSGFDSFKRSTGTEFQEKLAQLLEEFPYITGIILDLRNNPGGICKRPSKSATPF